MKNSILQKRRAWRSVLFVLLLSVVGMTKVNAYDFSAVCPTGQTFYYTVIDSTNHYVMLTCPGPEDFEVCWSGYDKPTGDIILPEAVEYEGITYLLTTIGSYAFYDCSGLTGSLTIPNTVTTIESQAFYQCNGFAGSLTIPNSVTTIGHYAFYCCSGFTGSLTIPNSVTTIGGYAFGSCIGFTGSLIIPSSVSTISEGTFSNCGNLRGSLTIPNSVTLIDKYAFMNCFFTGNLTIPNSVTTIGLGAFWGCSCFTGTLTIPSSVTSIGNYAFYGCSGFTNSLSIPDSITYIGEKAFYGTAWYNGQPDGILYLSDWCLGYKGEKPTGVLNLQEGTRLICGLAFMNCTGLTSITIPDNVTTINGYAFSGCSGVTSVSIGTGLTAISNGVFNNCTGLTSITIPDNVITIGDKAFNGCAGLVSITIPDNVTSLGDEAFRGCTGVTSVSLGSGVTSIGSGAFRNCTGLTSIIIPDNVTLLGDDAFRNCTGATSLNIGSGLISIGKYAFQNCIGLTSIIIPDNVVTLDESAFRDCIGVTTISLGLGLTTTGSSAFMNCSSVTSINLGTNLTSIGGSTFMNCTSLTSITIPNSVTTIGGGAFNGCTSLASITIPDNVTSLGAGAFSGCTGATSLTIGSGVTAINSQTFQNCSSLTSIIIPDNVTSLGRYVFKDCSGATSLSIGAGVTTILGYAFHNCSSLASITIPDNVTKLDEGAFENCTGATSISIGSGLTSTGAYSFRNCSSVTSLSLGSGLNTISLDAFRNCTSLTSITIPNNVTIVGGDAFKDCTDVTSLTIGTGVTAIYVHAFYGCNSINSIIIAANTPPTLSNSVFYGVPTTIPVYVPCDALEAYQNANGWSNFTNIVEACDLEIVASANPSEGGTVEGDGSYGLGQTCTLTTSANEDYLFVNWTENGEEISTNSTYSFTVMGERTLVANFSEIVNHWEPESNPYEDNMTLTCVVQIDGVEQATTMLELGAFCGTQCRGSQRATYFAPTDRYIFQMTVFGESSDVISFRLYDHQLGEELVLTSPAPVAFNSNGYGSLSNPYVLNFTSAITHTQAFNSGWNWWSTYIELTDNDGLNQLENSLSDAGIMIKSRTNGYVEAYEYNGATNWYGTLSSINNEQMYKIRTNAACNATVEGLLAVPANHPISINSGWNWIGFPCNQDMSVDVAMSGFTPENEDIIKGRNGFTTYYSDGNYTMWYGTLNTFEPGKGYMYRSNSTTQKTLVFQTGRGETVIENITSENNHFQPFGDDFADNMSIMAVLEMDGEELRSEDFELAAFVGDECRGSVRLMYVEPVDRYVAFLTVFGEPSETLYFRLTDGTQTELSMDEVAFVADGMAGTLVEPMTLRFGSTWVDENEPLNVVVYPNPSDGVFNIQGQGIRKIEVFNPYGQIVLSEEISDDFLQIDLGSCAKGIYMLRVITDKGMAQKQIIKH